MKIMFGRSFSHCIRYLAADGVDADHVGAIVSSTRAVDQKDFDRLVKYCADNYWTVNTDKAIEIAYALWNAGKIVQPRLINNAYYQNIADYSLWGDSLEDVQKSLTILETW